MKTRNRKYNIHGTIDCEIEHPIHGWIPFTADPADPLCVAVYNDCTASEVSEYKGPSLEDIENRGKEAKERQEKEDLIQAKLREIAEAELKKEGKLDISGKLVTQIEK